MASIIKRPSCYYVVYYYLNDQNQKKQKWESGYTYEQAITRKKELEQKELSFDLSSLPPHPTVSQFIVQWLPIYAQSHWELKTYMSSQTCIQNHIAPYIGNMKLNAVTSFQIESLLALLHRKVVKSTPIPKYLSTSTIRKVYLLLCQIFEKAVKWGYIAASPVQCKAPRQSSVQPEIWPLEAFTIALSRIEQPFLHLAVHLAFVCSLRRGEIFAITLDDIDFEDNSISINKTIQRVDKTALEIVSYQGVLHIYPSKKSTSKSTLIIKRPKTDSSSRKVFLTHELMREIRLVLKQKEIDQLNYGWQENNLLFYYKQDGTPIDPTRCVCWFRKWQREQIEFPYPHIPFHAIRHSSVSYKLLISQGDYKSVQADTGHKTANVLLNIYAKIQDKQRRELTSKLANVLVLSNNDKDH